MDSVTTNPDGSWSVLVDNGDGTGTVTHHAPGGSVTGSEGVSGLRVGPAPVDQQAAAVAALLGLVAEHGPTRVGVGLRLGLGITDQAEALAEAAPEVADPAAQVVAQVVADAAVAANP